MRIGIDVRYLSHSLVGGIHTYLANLVPALLELGAHHQIFLYADTKRPFELADLPAHVTIRLLPWHGPLSSVAHDLMLLRRWMRRDQLDVAHFPANYGFGPTGARTVITLHDAINILPLREIIRGHPKHPRTIGMMTYLHLLSTAAVRRADLILTVSSYARDEIVRVGRLQRDRVVPVPHAPTPDLRRVEDPATLAAVRQRHGIAGGFVLADGLKNPAVLVRAWRLLAPEVRAGRELVFFARRPDVLPELRAAVEAGAARLLVRPSREDLIALYSLADVFAFPSWIEGFGIPLLEAMTCGAPIIASNRGAIPEVVGGAALLADADDAEGFARHLTTVLGDPARAAQLRAAGHVRGAGFSWQATAARTLDCYADLVSGPTGQRAPAVRSL